MQHPPEEFVREFGRANQPGKPVFYGTTDWSTIFWELRVNVGEVLVTSTWITQRELRLMLVGYAPNTLDKLGTGRRFDVGAESPSLSKDANEAVNEFLALQFTERVLEKERHRYKLTAAIASLFLEEPRTGKKAPHVDGLMYPTVARNGRADNVAFLPEIVFHDLKLDSVELIGVGEVEYPDKYGLAKLDRSSSVDPDGTIRWTNYADKAADSAEEFLFTLEGHGNWVLRNSKGEVVETLVSKVKKP